MCGLCTRRAFIAGGLATFVIAWPGADAAENEPRIMCGFTNEELRNYRNSMSSKSDDPKRDDALIAELESILKIFPVDPGFKYVKAANAAATDETVVQGTRGTVFIGIDFVKSLSSRDDGGISVAGVLAHECAHIFQYFSPYGASLRGPTNFLMELHADVLAGYYMEKKLGSATKKLSGVQLTFLQAATYNTSDPRHHGTPGQRNAAFDKGYLLSRSGKSFEQAAREGEDYVRKL